MQDACDASLTSIRKLFPNVKCLMCFFHVKKNVKDNLLPKEKRDELKLDLTVIHNHNINLSLCPGHNINLMFSERF